MNLLSYFFNTLWPLVWHFGTGVGVIIIGVLVWWFTPFRATGLAIAAGAAIFLVSFSVGVKDGSDRVQAKWDAAEQAALKRGQDARDEADTWVRDHPVVKPPSGWLRYDRDIYNRDKDPVRRVAPNHVLPRK